jgi:hypothetical protein
MKGGEKAMAFLTKCHQTQARRHHCPKTMGAAMDWLTGQMTGWATETA